MHHRRYLSLAGNYKKYVIAKSSRSVKGSAVRIKGNKAKGKNDQ